MAVVSELSAQDGMTEYSVHKILAGTKHGLSIVVKVYFFHIQQRSTRLNLKHLRQLGYHLESLAIVDSMDVETGTVPFRNEDNT